MIIYHVVTEEYIGYTSSTERVHVAESDPDYFLQKSDALAVVARLERERNDALVRSIEKRNAYTEVRRTEFLVLIAAGLRSEKDLDYIPKIEEIRSLSPIFFVGEIEVKE